jgi:hypothetical protein
MYSLIQGLYAASGGEYNPKGFKEAGIVYRLSFEANMGFDVML